MTIRYYVHAWQGLLMFLAGLVSVLGAFGGYVQSGGGEELLHRLLANLKTGRASFDSLAFKWKTGEIVVTNLRHEPFEWPKQNPIASFKGLLAKEMTVKLELLPWPPAVESITVQGMPETAIAVSEGFLQTGKLQELHLEHVPPIRFIDCNLELAIGVVGPLKLSGCSGELRRGSAKEPPRGSFSLSALDGKPFNFKLEMLEDGRWVLTGDRIQLDTRAIKAQGNPFAGQVDPVGLLVRGLFAGDMGAKGTISSLRLTVQPATGARKFVCDGEVGYKDMEFNLPKPMDETGLILPFWLDRLLCAGENLWPRWMQVDVVRTGADGRVAFHMADGRLNFACDEGPGSAFTGIRSGQTLPPLEALKGAVETDENNRPKRIVLRGFLGEELGFETHVENNPDRSHTYEMLLGPRGSLPQAAAEHSPGKPLWRFASRLTSYLDVDKELRPSTAGERSLVSFALEAEALHFPWPNWLPPGMRDASGRISAHGRFTDKQRLRVDAVNLDDVAALVYGGAAGTGAGRSAGGAPAFGPLGEALQEFFGTAKPWELQNLTLCGRADVEFNPDLRWQRTVLDDFVLVSGSLAYNGRITDLAPAGILLTALHTREPEMSEIGISVYAPDKWKLRLAGAWRPDGSTGTFKLLEDNVPFGLHPQRDVLPPGLPVSRETSIQIEKDKPPKREVKPVAPGGN